MNFGYVILYVIYVVSFFTKHFKVLAQKITEFLRKPVFTMEQQSSVLKILNRIS